MRPGRLGRLGVAALLVGCAPGHAERGRQALARGDHAGAIAELEMAARADPDQASLWRDLARAYMRAIEPKRAESAIDRAHELAPDDAQTILLRAQIRLALERREQALADARHVLAHATSPRMLEETAVLFLRLHRPEEAIEAAKRAVVASKDDPTAYANLAVLATKAGRDDVAERAFGQGRRIHPEHPGLAQAHAAWLIGAGEIEKARAVYRGMLATHPEPGLVHLAIALLSHTLGELADAQRHSRAAVDALGKERADVHYTHIVVLRDAGELEAARDHLGLARQRFPGDEDLATLAAQMGAR